MKKALVVVLSMVFSPLILGMMTPFLIGMAEGLIFLFILFICRKIEKYILVFIGIDKENRELLRNLSAAQEDWRRRKARMYVTRELGGITSSQNELSKIEEALQNRVSFWRIRAILDY